MLSLICANSTGSSVVECGHSTEGERYARAHLRLAAPYEQCDSCERGSEPRSRNGTICRTGSSVDRQVTRHSIGPKTKIRAWRTRASGGGTVATRDDFSLTTKSTLAGRAGHACSNPDCRRPTAGAARGDDAKVVNVGVAAHIKGAAPGGPRYDPLQTAEERRHASNGIWLCSAHAKQIDDDHAHFTVDKLKT